MSDMNLSEKLYQLCAFHIITFAYRFYFKPLDPNRSELWMMKKLSL